MKESVRKTGAWVLSHKSIFIAALMSFLPLLCCVVACAAQGRNIGEVYLPAGEWNDELFYFKQVEGIVHYGYPRGFFGFNESYALRASFAAWSPVLVFPWVLWGLVFGWNLQSPIYCNIFLMMLSMFLFVWLVKPGRKQLGILTILYITFRPLTRYMLSGMPECICFSLVIIVLALCSSYQKREHPAKLVLLFVLTAVMTLMRPYLLLFMLLPIYFRVRKQKIPGLISSLVIVGAVGVVYALIKHYFGAEYFTPLFDTTWVTTFLDQGVFAGIHYMAWRIVTVGIQYGRIMLEGLRSDLFYGEYFVAYTVVMLVILVQALHDFRKKQWKNLEITLYLSVCFVGMWVALILMYKMQEGSKHLLTFLAVGIFAISMMETRFYKKMVLVAATFALLFTVSGVDPYEYQIPFRNEELEAREAYWEETLEEACDLELTSTPGFDNVIIWVLADRVDGKSVLTPYQMLYQIPKGFGISCCYVEYVKENLGWLHSRFLAVVAEGEVDKLCREKGYREIGRDEGMVVYELHGKLG